MTHTPAWDAAGPGVAKPGWPPTTLPPSVRASWVSSRQALLPAGEVGKDSAHKHGPTATVSYRHCRNVGDHLGGLDINHVNRGMYKCDKYLGARIGNVT